MGVAAGKESRGTDKVHSLAPPPPLFPLPPLAMFPNAPLLSLRADLPFSTYILWWSRIRSSFAPIGSPKTAFPSSSSASPCPSSSQCCDSSYPYAQHQPHHHSSLFLSDCDDDCDWPAPLPASVVCCLSRLATVVVNTGDLRYSVYVCVYVCAPGVWERRAARDCVWGGGWSDSMSCCCVSARTFFCWLYPYCVCPLSTAGI